MAVGAAFECGLRQFAPWNYKLSQAGNSILPEEYHLNRKQHKECNVEIDTLWKVSVNCKRLSENLNLNKPCHDCMAVEYKCCYKCCGCGRLRSSRCQGSGLVEGM